jgi:uncharacterized protein YecE (DUF72 family)
LEFASREFDTIELNGTFYSLQRPQSFSRWYEETPDDFIFSVKGSRFITHMRRLREIERPLARFFAQGILNLGKKLGPILWQFPPNFTFDEERFASFFSLLPNTHAEAATLVHKYAEDLDSERPSPILGSTPLRHAIEIRNESFVTERFIKLLKAYRIALVVADTVEWPLLMDATTDFVYCRLHGSEQLYASGYEDPALQIWAERAATWARGGEVSDARRVMLPPKRQARARNVFVYFDNDAKVRAPFDAHNLRDRVSRLLPELPAIRSSLHVDASDR